VRDRDKHVFECEFELLDLAFDLLGGFAERLLPEPGDLQTECLDDHVMGAQPRSQLRVWACNCAIIALRGLSEIPCLGG